MNNQTRIWLVTLVALLLLIFPIYIVIKIWPDYSPRVKMMAYSAAFVVTVIAAILIFIKSKNRGDA
jgi:uncharacterized membrane protein